MSARLLVVGDPFFLARHAPLVGALRTLLGDVEEVAVREPSSVPQWTYLARGYLARPRWPLRPALAEIRARYTKEPATFDRLSGAAASGIAQRAAPGAFALQLFSMSSPVTTRSGERPYAHYVDMTMALVQREWPAWAPFRSAAARAAWLAREGTSYRGAERVFTFSEATRRSVIEDYGARPDRVVAVGAAGHYADAGSGERSYGTHTLVFNGSDFERKGGDRVLAAFRLLRARFSDATLTIVGNTALAPEPGLRLPGKLARRDVIALLDSTDVVLAPTRLDVLPGFVLEAMSRGVVPVLSDAASMAEMVVDGRDGFVVSPPTPERLAARVAELFATTTLLRSFGIAARERVVRDWNWDAVAARMVASLAEGGLP